MLSILRSEKCHTKLCVARLEKHVPFFASPTRLVEGVRDTRLVRIDACLCKFALLAVFGERGVYKERCEDAY